MRHHTSLSGNIAVWTIGNCQARSDWQRGAIDIRWPALVRCQRCTDHPGTWIISCRQTGIDVVKYRSADGIVAQPDVTSRLEGDIMLLDGSLDAESARQDALQAGLSLSDAFGIMLSIRSHRAESTADDAPAELKRQRDHYLGMLRNQNEAQLETLKLQLDREFKAKAERTERELSSLSSVVHFPVDCTVNLPAEDIRRPSRSSSGSILATVEAVSTRESSTQRTTTSSVTRPPQRSATNPPETRPTSISTLRKLSMPPLRTGNEKPVAGALRSPGTSIKRKSVRISADAPTRIDSPAVRPEESEASDADTDGPEDGLFDLDETLPRVYTGSSAQSMKQQITAIDDSLSARLRPRVPDKYRSKNGDVYEDREGEQRSSVGLQSAFGFDAAVDGEPNGTLSIDLPAQSRERDAEDVRDVYATSLPMPIPPPVSPSNVLQDWTQSSDADGKDSKSGNAAELSAQHARHQARKAALSLATIRQGYLGPDATVVRSLTRPLSSIKDVPLKGIPASNDSLDATARGALRLWHPRMETNAPRALAASDAPEQVADDVAPGHSRVSASQDAPYSERDRRSDREFTRRRKDWHRAIEASLRMSGLILPADNATGGSEANQDVPQVQESLGTDQSSSLEILSSTA
ncbi:hypothetical protein PYCC9005_003574 [Savitreella phatthalungensis]